MTLYEINSQIYDLVDPETGELQDYEAFLGLEMERTKKIEDTVLIIKDLEAEASEIKAEEQKLNARRKAKENAAKRLRQYIEYMLDGEKFETARCAVSYRNVTALGISAFSAAAEWLEENGHKDLVVYAAPTLDKRGVTALLKMGVDVPGAQLEQRRSTIIK